MLGLYDQKLNSHFTFRVDFDQTVSLSAIDPERTSLVDINQS